MKSSGTVRELFSMPGFVARAKDLDMFYMQQQVALAGMPAPRAIGIDKDTIRKGHNYRGIVSNLERARPIWVGGAGRKADVLDCFFATLGPKKAACIVLAVMDLWKPFRIFIASNIPEAQFILDKFHIMRHLADTFDQHWGYRSEHGARAFLERWLDALKRQRLEACRKFAHMIDQHWDGIVSYCDSYNKVSLGLVDGFNNKSYVLQRWICGHR